MSDNDTKPLNMEKNKLTTLLITGVVCLLIGIAIGWALLKTGTKTTDIKMKIGNNELSINLDQDLQDNAAILEKLFSERFAEVGTKDWLKKNKQLFSPQDIALVSPIEGLDFDAPISKLLRELSFARKGPWAYQVDTVVIGIPPRKFRPEQGAANVCENGDYLNEDIRIYTMDHSNSIEVKAQGTYECPSQLKFPDIQLHHKDAIELLGRENFKKFESGMALIITKK